MTPHILVAEDDADTCELIQLILQLAGFRFSFANNLSDVLHLVARERFDALLLDNCMPEITGVELCRRIRTFDQTTPILFCSGAVTQADIQAAMLAGAQGYVAKPFAANDLVRALRSVLNKGTHQTS